MDRSKWEYKKLGEIAKFIGGGTPSKANEDYYTGNIPWATVRDMVDFNLSKTELCITDQAVKESATNIVPKDTIIISTHVGLGKICLLMQDTAINQDLKGVILPQSVDKLFFAAWYKSIADYVISNGKGATVKGVTMKFVNDLKMPVPSIADQQRIVAELDFLNEMIALKQEQLKEFDKLAQSIFYDMFGPGLFDNMPLSDIGNIVTGSTPTTKNIDNYSSNDVCFFKPSDLLDGSVSKLDQSEFYISNKAYEGCRKLPKNTILVCCIGSIGKLAITNVESTCNQQINAIIPKSFMDSYYIAYAMLEKKMEMVEMANAPVVPIINKGNFSKIRIQVPPLALQQQFAEKIQAIEAQKELVKKSIAETQQLLDSRMDFYFD